MALLKAGLHRVRRSIATITILFPRYPLSSAVTCGEDEMLSLFSANVDSNSSGCPETFKEMSALPLRK